MCRRAVPRVTMGVVDGSDAADSSRVGGTQLNPINPVVVVQEPRLGGCPVQLGCPWVPMPKVVRFRC